MRSRIEAMWYGQRGPVWMAPLSGLYGLVMAFRSVLYRLGLRHRIRIGVPVVVVGNLTVGGTGKTPVVEKFARELQDQGRTVAILSRGYRSKPPPLTKRL